MHCRGRPSSSAPFGDTGCKEPLGANFGLSYVSGDPRKVTDLATATLVGRVNRLKVALNCMMIIGSIVDLIVQDDP